MLNRIIKVAARMSFFCKLFIFYLGCYSTFRAKNIFTVYFSPGFEFDFIGGRFEVGSKVHARRRLRVSLRNGVVSIGKNVFINRDVSINCHKRISIGDNCLIGESVKFYDHNHKFKGLGLISMQGFSVADIVIEENVWIGSGVIILKGVTIGRNSVISAGLVVRADVPENHILTIDGLKAINRESKR